MAIQAASSNLTHVLNEKTDEISDKLSKKADEIEKMQELLELLQTKVDNTEQTLVKMSRDQLPSYRGVSIKNKPSLFREEKKKEVRQ